MDKVYRSLRHKKLAAQALAQKISELYFLLKPQYTEDLTHQSVRVLQFIQMSPPNLRVDDVRRHLNIAATSASELVKRLSTKGMVERRRSATDERVVELRLTEKGLLTLQQQTQMDVEKLEQCLAHFDDEEDATLLDMLDTLLLHAASMSDMQINSGEESQ